jgi:hypothetical protein
MATTPWQVIVTFTGAGFMPGFPLKIIYKNQLLTIIPKPPRRCVLHDRRLGRRADCSIVRASPATGCRANET